MEKIRIPDHRFRVQPAGGGFELRRGLFAIRIF